MKEFTNLDRVLAPELVAELRDEHTVFFVNPKVDLPAFEDAYITAIEYIGEVWRNDYDDEDIEFLLDNLYFDPAHGLVYILEHTGYPEEEPTLFFERIWIRDWTPITKWAVTLETDLYLTDADKVIIYANEGWYNVNTNSFVITLNKLVIVETPDIEQYIAAVNRIGGDIKVVDYEPAYW